MSKTPSILLSGATGYVGARLLHALENKKILVRVVSPRDVGNATSLNKALKGIHTAFYLAENADYKSAKSFAHACAVHKVQKIIYLSGLGNSADNLSPHVRRQQKIGEILLASGIPVVEFRVSLIIGPGSFTFEIIRALADRLRVIVMPHWVYTQTQPIAMDDVMEYLLEAISFRGPSRVFEIGGPERVPFGELIREYSRQSRLRCWIIPLPTFASRLSSFYLSYWMAWDKSKARLFLESFRVPAVVSHPEALRVFRVQPRSLDKAITLAHPASSNNS